MISQLVRRRPFTGISRAVASASRCGPFRSFASGSAERDWELAHKDAIIAEKIARIDGLKRELGLKDEIIAAKDVAAAAAAAHWAELMAAKAVVFNAQAAASAMSEAHAMHKADEASGIVSVRAVFETAVETLWIMGGCGDHNAARKMNVTAMLQDVLNEKNCPGLLHYLAVAAEDNKVMFKTVLDQAKKLYSTASTRLHSEGAAGTGESFATVPTEVFAGQGRVTLIAMAALISFTGRALTLYDVDFKKNFAERGARVSLRVPPLTGCKATLGEVRAQPFVVHMLY